ncbi:MAG: DUF2089 domain-containing protein [Bacilli bacterium]
MQKKIIGICPICGENLKATELTCNKCDTKIHGDFHLSKFDYLTSSQQEFALVFLKNAGNIKLIEKELNISYPTVKKNLEEVIYALGFDKSDALPTSKLSKEEIYAALRKGDITIEEAENLLKERDNNE